MRRPYDCATSSVTVRRHCSLGAALQAFDEAHDGLRRIPGRTLQQKVWSSHFLRDVRSNPLLGAAATLLARDLILGASLKCLPHFILNGLVKRGLHRCRIEAFCAKYSIREPSYGLGWVLAQPGPP